VPHDPFTLGRYDTTPLCDGWAPLPLDDEVPGVEVDWDVERERFPWAFPPADPSSWAWHVHAFLIRHPDGLALVDTGIGHFGRSPFDVGSHLDDELDAVGASADDVRDVVLTHLHADHSGGVCRPDGTPRFSNARHHVHPDDWTFFAEQRAPDDFTGRFAMAAVEEAGLLSLEEGDHEIRVGIQLRHAPGHTPGHRVAVLTDGDDTLLLTGDLLHTTPQITHATSLSNHDEDPETAAKHRSALVEAARAGDWAVGVSHFGSPFGRVVGAVGAPDWSSVEARV
jgi:glyoxylase-like metal-dependent hydrolase (beta-lactamase superfamily II)